MESLCITHFTDTANRCKATCGACAPSASHPPSRFSCHFLRLSSRIFLRLSSRIIPVTHIPATFVTHIPATLVTHSPATFVAHNPATFVAHIPATLVTHILMSVLVLCGLSSCTYQSSMLAVCPLFCLSFAQLYFDVRFLFLAEVMSPAPCC